VVALFFFYNATGAGILIFYSTTLLEKMGENGSLSLDPKVGSSILGFTYFLGSVLSPIPMRYVSIKTLVVLGQFICGFCLILIGVF